MSDILQRTLKALVGGGEGVGWSIPSQSEPHSLSPALAGRDLINYAYKPKCQSTNKQQFNKISILNPEAAPSIH